jgi:hypothetical protein
MPGKPRIFGRRLCIMGSKKNPWLSLKTFQEGFFLTGIL